MKESVVAVVGRVVVAAVVCCFVPARESVAAGSTEPCLPTFLQLLEILLLYDIGKNQKNKKIELPVTFSSRTFLR